jgi:hypothetical protein
MEYHGRGAAAQISMFTSLTEPEISNWVAGRRDLTDSDVIEVIEWLGRTDQLSITVTAIPQGKPHGQT